MPGTAHLKAFLQDMEKHNILFFHESGLFYGSTEKLLQLFAKHLAGGFNVYFAYSPKLGEQQKSFLGNTDVKMVPFSIAEKQQYEPYTLFGMEPDLAAIIFDNRIECVITIVSAHYQFPINAIPASIPVVLISPFGHWATNGAVFKTYVSGVENLERLKKRGVKSAEMLFNPLEDFSAEVLHKELVGDKVVFGRIGRGDDQIFDPIAVYAFKKLEEKYGEKVKYIVANPSSGWIKLANQLGIRQMEFLPRLNEQELAQFYHNIDIFAHARKDGETIGIAIAEAMMAGNPIVTHKSHFHNEHLRLLDVSFARWCEVDDVEAYFKNMEWFVEHKEKIREMGALARKKSLSIFGMDVQLPEFTKTITEACKKCTHYNGKWATVKGYARLYWENFKVTPFRIGKMLTNKFPGTYKILRKFYYE